MLFDSKKHLKAKKYECIMVRDKDGKGNEQNSYSHLIRPAGTETEMIEIDPVQIVSDFITLIGEYSKCQHLQEMISTGPLPYKGIKDKAAQNRITIVNRHYYKEEKQMLDALMAFINKYGLLGLLNDDAVGFDYNQKQADGSWHFLQYPDSAIVYDTEDMQYTRIPYDEYIQPYFPECAASDAMQLKGAARILQYSEFMEDILQNRRFMDCVEYIAGIDKERRPALPIYDLKAALSFRNGIPVYDVQSRSLIQYCHTMFFLNELGAGKDHVCICQYKLCHRPFIGNRMYCSEACMRNANKAKKKGVQENG